jgi:hypothetical protein
MAEHPHGPSKHSRRVAPNGDRAHRFRIRHRAKGAENSSTDLARGGVFPKMKTPHSCTRFAFLAKTSAFVALSLCVPVSAQQTPARESPREGRLNVAQDPATTGQSGGAPKATSAWEAARSAMQIILPEVDIPAGQHLRGVVELLSAKTGANIVLEESLNDLKLPALKLRNVNVTSVLDTIRTISKGELGVSHSEDRGPGASVVIVSSRRGEAKKPSKICRVFRLLPSGPGLPSIADTPLDDEKTKKALAEKVEHISEAGRQACRALAMANGKTKADADYPAIEVHAPTHLLMVIGEEPDVDLVAQIISGVGGIPMSSATPEPRRVENQPALRR